MTSAQGLPDNMHQCYVNSRLGDPRPTIPVIVAREKVKNGGPLLLARMDKTIWVKPQK